MLFPLTTFIYVRVNKSCLFEAYPGYNVLNVLEILCYLCLWLRKKKKKNRTDLSAGLCPSWKFIVNFWSSIAHLWTPIQQGCFQKQLRLQQNRSLWFTFRLCSFKGLVCSEKQISKTCIHSRTFCAAVSTPVFLRRHDLRLIKHALEISGEKHRHIGMFFSDEAPSLE